MIRYWYTVTALSLCCVYSVTSENSKDSQLIPTLPSRLLGKSGKAHKERGYEDLTGFICKRFNNTNANNTGYCDTIFQNLTKSCRGKQDNSRCMRNLTTGQPVTLPSFLSFKAKDMQSVEDSLGYLGPCCEYVEVDQQITANACPSTIPWNLDRIDEGKTSDSTRDYYPAGRGGKSIVFVIDTGIYSAHSEFKIATGTKVVGGYNVFDTSAPASDGHGHGTHVSGTAAGLTYGVAKDAYLYAVKVLDDTGSGSTSGVIAGISHMTTKCAPAAGDTAHPGAGWFAVPAAAGGGYRRCVGSMSLGGGFVQSLNDAVQNAVLKSNIPMAVAAGNDGASASSSSPASAPLAITVGASDSSDLRASFSNYGVMVDIYAPGVSVVSAGISSTTATATMSGTSMATPHVSGAVALLLTINTTMRATSAVTALFQTGLASFVSGPDGCKNALLQVLRAGSNTCDGDATKKLLTNVSWSPSPCGTCSGAAAACPAAPTCTAAIPRGGGCDCLSNVDCKSGVCNTATFKCTAPPTNATTAARTTTTTPPPTTCSATNPCSVGDTPCDTACCQAYGPSYYSAYRSGGYCMCYVCSAAAAAAAAPPSTTAPGNGNGNGNGNNRKRSLVLAAVAQDDAVGGGALQGMAVSPAGAMVCAVLLVGGVGAAAIARRRAGRNVTVAEEDGVAVVAADSVVEEGSAGEAC